MTFACSGSGKRGQVDPAARGLARRRAHVGRDRRTDGRARQRGGRAVPAGRRRGSRHDQHARRDRGDHPKHPAHERPPSVGPGCTAITTAGDESSGLPGNPHGAGLQEAPALLHDLAVGAQPPAGAQVADEVPVQGGSGSCRRSRDRSARARGGRSRRSSRRRGSCPSGARCRSWCRCRSRPGSARRRRWRARAAGSSSPTSARADSTSPSRSSSSTPSTSTPAGAERHGEAHAAARRCARAGPVKTSPLGMLRLPSELTHVRPATLSVRSVPSASMRSSRGVAQAGDQALLEGAQPAPGGDRIGLVEEQRAAHEGREVVERHPRLRRRAPRSATASSTSASSSSPRGSGAARGRSARSASGSTPASSRALAGAWMPSSASTFLASVEREVGVVVEVRARARAS